MPLYRFYFFRASPVFPQNPSLTTLPCTSTPEFFLQYRVESVLSTSAQVSSSYCVTNACIMARPPAPGLILRAGFNPLIATAVVCGVCSVAYVMTSGSRNSSSHSSNKPDKVFSGGPAFVSLTLEQSDMLNHNTKRLRFRLPNEDSISGHSLTCKNPLPTARDPF